MANFSEKINKEIKKVGSSYSSCKSTLLGCSGGMDSVVLFFFLLKIKNYRNDFDFQVFHLNHSIEGNEKFSEESETLVKKICQQNNIVLHSKKIVMARERLKYPKMSEEQVGRLIRHRELENIAKNEKIDTISTAHHQDDLAETMIMRLFQGVGVNTLAFLDQGKQNIKPLLPYTKQDVYQFQKFWNLPFCEDPSNKNQKYLRNKVRNQLIPLIKDVFPNFQGKLLQFQGLLKEREVYFNRFSLEWRLVCEDCYELDLAQLLKIPSFLIKDSLKKGIQMLDREHYITSKQLKYMHDYLNSYSKKNTQEYKIIYNKKDLQGCLQYGKVYFFLKKIVQKKSENIEKIQRQLSLKNQKYTLNFLDSKDIIHFENPITLKQFFKRYQIISFEKACNKGIFIESNCVGMINSYTHKMWINPLNKDFFSLLKNIDQQVNSYEVFFC